MNDPQKYAAETLDNLRQFDEVLSASIALWDEMPSWEGQSEESVAAFQPVAVALDAIVRRQAVLASRFKKLAESIRRGRG